MIQIKLDYDVLFDTAFKRSNKLVLYIDNILKLKTNG